MRKLNKLIISVVGGLALLMPNTILQAQTFPKVYVFSEDDEADNISCSVSHKSAVSTVQAALRNNGIQIEYSSDDSVMRAYVNVGAINLSNGCAVNWSLIFQNYQYVDDEFLKRPFFATIVYCKKGGILTGSASEVYSGLLLYFRDKTNECVSEYYENIKK